MIREPPKKGQTWLHYRGGRYEILLTATETDSGEPFVVYRSLESGKIWTRSLYRFMSRIIDAEHPEPGVWRYVKDGETQSVGD